MIQKTYLNDKEFLKQLDKLNIKERFLKITLLDWQEREIKYITAKLIDGSFNIDGSSSVRRTANLSAFIENDDEKAKESLNDFSIAKKIKIEIGIKNLLYISNKYKDVDIFWFPMGIYVICSLNFSHNTEGINLSLQVKDKMCLLNGDIAGVFPANIILSEANLEEFGTTEDEGVVKTYIPTIFQIIQELVNHWGGEQLGNIVISDVPSEIEKIVRWSDPDNKNLIIYPFSENSNEYGIIRTSWKDDGISKPEAAEAAIINKRVALIEPYKDAGYAYEKFVYPGTLSANAGSSITSVLDQIKNTLGNYEYFYDIDGTFIFQEIKNFLNTTEATTADKLNANDYFAKNFNMMFKYDFDDSTLINSYNSAPQINMIKNDFIVLGEKTSVDNQKTTIKYHVAIDKKPILTEDELNGTNESYYTLFKQKVPTVEGEKNIPEVVPTFKYDNFDAFPDIPKPNAFYEEMSVTLDVTATRTRRAGRIYQAIDFKSEYDLPPDKKDRYVSRFQIMILTDLGYTKKEDGVLYNYFYKIPKITDWRTKLYYEGLLSERLGIESNYYYAELLDNWPRVYDIYNNRMREDVRPEDREYFLDFIDVNSEIDSININNIGRRTKVVNNSHINCLFSPDIPEYKIIFTQNNGSLSQDQADKEQELIAENQKYYKTISQLEDEEHKYIADKFSTGGYYANNAFDEIRELIRQYTEYNNSVSIQCTPIYHLEPNTIISLNDYKTGIYGEYLIKTISIPLSINGLMTITATKILNKF